MSKEDALDAAMDGDLALLKSIIDKDPSKIHFNDEDGYFPIHRASYNGHCSIIEFLLDHGADINARTEDQWCPLHSAVNWEEVGSVDVLLRRGARVNAASSSGQTPAHIAAKNQVVDKSRKKEIIELLLGRPDIDLTLRNDLGETPVDLARRYSEYSALFEEKAKVDTSAKAKEQNKQETERDKESGKEEQIKNGDEQLKIGEQTGEKGEGKEIDVDQQKEIVHGEEKVAEHVGEGDNGIGIEQGKDTGGDCVLEVDLVEKVEQIDLNEIKNKIHMVDNLIQK